MTHPGRGLPGLEDSRGRERLQGVGSLPGGRSSEGVTVLAKDIGAGCLGFHHLAANLDLGNAPDEGVAAAL